MILVAAQVAAIIFLAFFIPAVAPVTVTFAVMRISAIVISVVLLLRHSSPEVKCAWFAVISIMPVAGTVFLLLASLKKKPQGVLTVVGAPDGTDFARAAKFSCGTVKASYLKAEYFSSGTKFWNRAVAEISGAKKSVYIEFFIVRRGHLFNMFLAALESAKKNGAEIKMICDGFGAGLRLGKKDLKKLKSAGAEVKFFNRLPLFPHARINLRDHRKIISVDGRIAFTGGVNLADEYINVDSPYGFWKDSGFAVQGGAAKVFEGMFLAMWHGRHEIPAPDMTGKTCLPYCDAPDGKSFCEDAYVAAINEARTRVHIMTPYFCTSEKTFSALSFAARRGIDVSVIIPHVPDKKYAFAASKAFAAQLVEFGVKFYEFTPGFMHAKALICDGKAFLGSYNFDFRSAHYNYECGALFENEMCEEAERDFRECLSLSSPITSGRLSKSKKLSLFLLRLFAPLI